ncbi:conserved exported hypothetical protein [uncultured Desulfovibrio sp.]|uniref:Thioredoxin-like fold domain-containing protein n=2 Tax=Desulfovibrio TaxID=872 RepID=A0A212KX96_9BACT|nr:conserved exported hypothetical protein [uncultured Desulfovibrio sp.]VZH35238.1 conserved protein of unknown function [Desulfovibrio sp. 86]
MMWQHNIFAIVVSTLLFLPVYMAHAGTPMSDRVAVEAKVRAEVGKDLALPYNPFETLADRQCLDGRSAKDFQGDLVEYWVNLECSYCGIREPLQAQRAVPDMCIVVRHIPTDQYGESLKKALSYEALKKFSANAANLFWDKVLPQTALGIPVPYEASLLLAFQEAAIPAESFGEALADSATTIVNEDILAGYGRISITPTYVLAGIRFPSCDFTAGQLREALSIARKAREGDTAARDKVITIITNAQLNEKML